MKDKALLYTGILFVPGDRPERFAKGLTACSAGVILDLEDGVSPAAKEQARQAVRAEVEKGGNTLVRVNAVSTEDFALDAEALRGTRPRGIVIAKAETWVQIGEVRAVWPEVPLYPLVESPLGLYEARGIAQCPGVCQLALGALDLSASCAIAYPGAALLEYARLQLVLASSAAGLARPIDTPCPSFKDPEQTAAEARDAVSLGFGAKLCIHPDQVPVVHKAFSPSEKDIREAEEIVAALGGSGVVSLHGRMVDAPVAAWARQVLEWAKGQDA